MKIKNRSPKTNTTKSPGEGRSPRPGYQIPKQRQAVATNHPDEILQAPIDTGKCPNAKNDSNLLKRSESGTV